MKNDDAKREAFMIAVEALTGLERDKDINGLRDGFDALCRNLGSGKERNDSLFFGFLQSKPESILQTAFAMKHAAACCRGGAVLNKIETHTTTKHVARHVGIKEIFPDMWDEFSSALDQKDAPFLWKAAFLGEEAGGGSVKKESRKAMAYYAMRWALAHGRVKTDPGEEDFQEAVGKAAWLSRDLPEELHELGVGSCALSGKDLKTHFENLLKKKKSSILWEKAFEKTRDTRHNLLFAAQMALACFDEKVDPATDQFKGIIRTFVSIPERGASDDLLALRAEVFRKMEDAKHPNLWAGAFNGARSREEAAVYAVKRVLACDGRKELEKDRELPRAVRFAAANLSALPEAQREPLQKAFIGFLQKKGDVALKELALEHAPEDGKEELRRAFQGDGTTNILPPRPTGLPAPSSKLGGPSGAGTV